MDSSKKGSVCERWHARLDVGITVGYALCAGTLINGKSPRSATVAVMVANGLDRLADFSMWLHKRSKKPAND